jgi:hypothetical protein
MGALNDWARFLARVGRPYAEDRESGEMEAASLAALANGNGGGGAGKGGAKPAAASKRRGSTRRKESNAIEPEE